MSGVPEGGLPPPAATGRPVLVDVAVAGRSTVLMKGRSSFAAGDGSGTVLRHSALRREAAVARGTRGCGQVRSTAPGGGRGLGLLAGGGAAKAQRSSGACQSAVNRSWTYHEYIMNLS